MPELLITNSTELGTNRPPYSIFAIIPKIAQSKLDAAELTLDSISITNTQSNSYQMAINSTIRTDGSVHAVIDGFVGIMYLEDLQPQTPFSTLNFPQTTSDSYQTVNVDQHVEITDMKAFTVFNTWLLEKESLRVTMSGDTFIHVNGISRAYPATFKKTLTLKGMFKVCVVSLGLAI